MKYFSKKSQEHNSSRPANYPSPYIYVYHRPNLSLYLQTMTNILEDSSKDSGIFADSLAIVISKSKLWNIYRYTYVCTIRVGLIIPKLEQTKAGEMVSSYDYISHFNCFRQHIGVTAFYSEALLVYVVKNSSCM